MQCTNWISEYQTLIAGLLGFAGVMIAIWYNGKTAREQRWWERKIAAYEKVIEALHNSKMFSEEHFEADLIGRELPEEKSQELRHRAKQANDEILKATDIGTFLLSEKAMARLQHYRRDAKEASNAQMWYEYLEADLGATSRCLTDFIEIAKSDLKIK